jgi:hypothetical protein
MKNEQVSTNPEFLYPIARTFPFDEVCEQIVRELEIRNWDVPGIEVKFDEYGTGAQKFRMVRNIYTQDCKLWFCRKQRTMPGNKFNDTAGITEIRIPRQTMSVYEDHSGPTYHLYVGDNWEKDREWFLETSFVHSKMRNEPRRYLQYSGGCDCKEAFCGVFINHTHPGYQSPLLIQTDDCGREYVSVKATETNPPSEAWQLTPDGFPTEPLTDAPTMLSTKKVLLHFDQWLRENLLHAILAAPVPMERIDKFPTPEPIPMPDTIGPIFTLGDHRDNNRIKAGKSGRIPDYMTPADMYGMLGNGLRFLSLDIVNDGSVQDLAYEGFLWCGIKEIDKKTDIGSLEIPGFRSSNTFDQYSIRITPKKANDIYIADWSPFEKSRSATFEGKDDNFRATSNDVNEWSRAAARTLIPISEYKGGFEKPVVLVRRELDFDEVEVVGGPWRYGM